MAGKFIICFVAAFALIQPFNTLPAAEPKQDVIYRNANGDYYTSDGVLLTDQYPVYWRQTQSSTEPKKEQVVIVEPTITYTRQAEYSSTQAAPSSSTFRSSAAEGQSGFRPMYDGSPSSQSAVAYYPYYVRASSSDRNDIEEKRRVEESSRRVVVDTSDPGYQRFIPRDGTTRDDRGQTYYYYSDGRPQSSSSSSTRQVVSSSARPIESYSSQLPTISSKSAMKFYYPNGTQVRTYYNEENKQVMDMYPNQYLIQVTELTTTTTPRPLIADCPPYQPCNTVVYQQTSQCCKCYLVPARCCPCSYPAKKK